MPVMPNTKGRIGTMAPEAKKQKLDAAAPQAVPDSFVLVTGFRQFRLQRKAGIAVAVEQAHPLRNAVLGGLPRHAAGQVDQQQFVVFDVQRAAPRPA